MVELMKLVVTKPLQAVVTLLCAGSLTLHIAMTEMKMAMAIVQEKQEVATLTAEKVIQMSDMLIRVDTNLSIVKQNQTELLKRELESK